MKQVIDDIREHEVKLIRKAALLRTCSDVLNLTSPYFVIFIFFLVLRVGEIHIVSSITDPKSENNLHHYKPQL